MNRIQLACYSLIASAFLLAGLLVAQLGNPLGAPAHAEMVLARDNFVLMTALTRSGEEALFVLDNNTGRLVIYRLDISKRELELAGGVDLPAIFGGASSVGGGRGR